MKRTLQVVPASKIKAFLADREFMGEAWFRFLQERDVPVIGSADGNTETHGTIRALSKECRVFGQEGLHLVGTRYMGREDKAEYLAHLDKQ